MFKEEALPAVEFLKSKDKCLEVDTSHDSQSVCELVSQNFAEYTDEEFAAKPLTERAEVLLGLRSYPEQDQ